MTTPPQPHADASTTSTGLVVWFEGYWAGLKHEIGGKASSLGEMTGAGLPVPPGFAITCSAYRRTRQVSAIDVRLESLLLDIDPTDLADVSRRCSQIRTLIETAALAPDVERQIRDAYGLLCVRSGLPDVPVAVRSSATSEDSPDASFAGEHDTYLWIRGGDAVIHHVRRCWASLYTDRALAYRVQMGYDHSSVDMCVVVQKMVRPKSAGVAFTLNPIDGDRSQVAIDSSWGFGEAVVAGEVTPDNFLVDKVLFEIGRRTISKKSHEYRLTDHDSVEMVDVNGDRATAPSLTDAEIKAIASLAKRAEKHYGCPQDIEWAVDADLPDGQNVIMLQSRPETVWSKHPRAVTAPNSSSGDFMMGIVAALVSPLHAKDKPVEQATRDGSD